MKVTLILYLHSSPLFFTGKEGRKEFRRERERTADNVFPRVLLITQNTSLQKTNTLSTIGLRGQQYAPAYITLALDSNEIVIICNAIFICPI